MRPDSLSDLVDLTPIVISLNQPKDAKASACSDFFSFPFPSFLILFPLFSTRLFPEDSCRAPCRSSRNSKRAPCLAQGVSIRSRADHYVIALRPSGGWALTSEAYDMPFIETLPGNPPPCCTPSDPQTPHGLYLTTPKSASSWAPGSGGRPQKSLARGHS